MINNYAPQSQSTPEMPQITGTVFVTPRIVVIHWNSGKIVGGGVMVHELLNSRVSPRIHRELAMSAMH